MKDEIKEILDKLKDDTYVPLEDNREYKLLDKGDDIILLDYITNLQEEINKLIAESTEWEERTYCWQDHSEDLQITIDKASDFIKEKINSTQGVINDYMYHKEHNQHLIELLREDIEMYKKELNILKGSEENE